MTNEEEFAARSQLTAEARRIAKIHGLINRAPLSPPTGYSGHANSPNWPAEIGAKCP